MAGNRAVAGLVSVARKVGWTDASTQGKAWNADEHQVGKVRRIPLEGLGEGLDASNPKDVEGREIAAMSSEKAKGKAIVLVPAALDATGSIEVVVFLHGWTEGLHRPYLGYRELTDPAPTTKDQSAALKERLPRLRQGVDATDTAPVRDVALDNAEQQLEESGQTQLVVILPQGGLHSQFSKTGGKDFDAGPFVNEVVARLKTEKRWKNAGGTVIDSAPTVGRITMAGHSGAGAALSHMANATVNARTGTKFESGKSSALDASLVLYDAINGGELEAFKRWATMRLDEDYAVLMDPTTTDEAKALHLQMVPKLRGYTTDAYIDQYIRLDKHIADWFAKHPKLGPWAPCLRANFTLDYFDLDHEELMRGDRAGAPRAAGKGNIAEAIRSLHPPRMTPSACPAIPAPLEDRYKAAKPPKKR
jgi:hypothetical protein